MEINMGVFTKNYYSDSLFRGTRNFNIRKNSDSLNYFAKTFNISSRITYDLCCINFNPTFLIYKNDEANGNGHFKLYVVGSMEVLSTTAKTSLQ